MTLVPDGRRALLGRVDGTVAMWDLTTGNTIHVFEKHKGWVRAVAMLPDGLRVLSAGEDGVLKLWDIVSGSHLGAFYGDAPVRCLSVSAPGIRAVTGNALGRLCILEIE